MRRLYTVSFFSGDGGNRTRVRKIQPSNVYERSWLFISLQVTTTSQGEPTAIRWDPKAPLSHG
jgi:hypothetical protein